MYFYLANVGFEPSPTSTAAPSNRDKKELSWLISLHYPSDRVTMFRCANTIIYIQGIPGSYGYRKLEIIYFIEDIHVKQILYNLQDIDVRLSNADCLVVGGSQSSSRRRPGNTL